MTCFPISLRRSGWMWLPAVLLIAGLWTVSAAAQPVSMHDRLATAAESAGFAEDDVSTLTALADEHLQPGTPGTGWAFVDAAGEAFSTEQLQALSEALMDTAPDRPRMRGERGRRGMRNGRGMRGRRGGPEGRGSWGDVGPNRLMEDLDLSDAQKTEMRAIRTEAREAMRDLRPDRGECPDEATMEEMRALRTQMRADMMAQLTPEQTEVVNERRAERMAMRQARRTERQQARNEALGLSAEQINQIDALHAEWMAENDMGPDMGPPMPRMMMRCQADGESAHAAMHEQVKDILTEDQQALADLHRALRMNAPPMRMGPRGMKGGR